jgi:beta-glucuronidase
MPIFFFLTGILILLCLLVWQHLFYRDAFRPPAQSKHLKILSIDGNPFLVENNLPYPAGIQATDHILIPLNGTWHFHLENQREPTQVEVPHCFNTADSPLRDYEGIAWYERDFSLPDWQPGSLIRLGFLGSFAQTMVWLEGQVVGSSESGYLPFFFDITKQVEPGKRHHLQVRVDNRAHSTSLPPRLFRGHNLGWHPFGGLHRGVSIEICPPVSCFKIRVNSELPHGTVQALVMFYHADGSTGRLDQATLSLFSPDGEHAGRADVPIAWDATGQYGTAGHRFSIENPQVWDFDSPVLYRLEVETEYERCETSFGVRSLETQDGKILLNGKPILLKGVCRHQEDLDHGLAQDHASIERDMRRIQDLNANFVRLAHYPHSADTLGLCD